MLLCSWNFISMIWHFYGTKEKIPMFCRIAGKSAADCTWSDRGLALGCGLGFADRLDGFTFG